MTTELVCEAHDNCKEQVVAKVGLPSSYAKWVCERGFNEFRQKGVERGNHRVAGS